MKIASDGASALETLSRTSGIALALVDVVMPGGMDGHAVADEIAKIMARCESYPHLRLLSLACPPCKPRGLSCQSRQHVRNWRNWSTGR